MFGAQRYIPCTTVRGPTSCVTWGNKRHVFWDTRARVSIKRSEDSNPCSAEDAYVKVSPTGMQTYRCWIGICPSVFIHSMLSHLQGNPRPIMVETKQMRTEQKQPSLGDLTTELRFPYPRHSCRLSRTRRHVFYDSYMPRVSYINSYVSRMHSMTVS